MMTLVILVVATATFVAILWVAASGLVQDTPAQAYTSLTRRYVRRASTVHRPVVGPVRTHAALRAVFSAAFKAAWATAHAKAEDGVLGVRFYFKWELRESLRSHLSEYHMALARDILNQEGLA